MTFKISAADFQQLVADEDTPDWLLRHFVEEDLENSRPFAPALRVKSHLVESEGVEAMGGMGSWNEIDHKKRLKKYRKALRDGYSGPRIVSEGDSWFLYPVLIRETVDHLYDRYAVYSWGASGDDLEQMVAQDQFLPAILEEESNVFIISAGGNDVLGNVAAMLHPFNSNFRPEDYPNDEFESALRRLEDLFDQVFAKVTSGAPEVRTFCHGYDYAIPKKRGKWLGKPMRKKLGIKNAKLQREIVRVLVDQFNERLASLASKYSPAVTYINCRGSVPNKRDWYDEIHPNSEGFMEIASKFARAIEKI
jgi:lysophospholipase L1-like esterase